MSRSGRPALRLPGLRRTGGRWASLPAAQLTDSRMILLACRYTRITRSFNSTSSYLPKLIQLILSLRKSKEIDYPALYVGLYA
jgi:hypothetical protein